MSTNIDYLASLANFEEFFLLEIVRIYRGFRENIVDYLEFIIKVIV